MPDLPGPVVRVAEELGGLGASGVPGPTPAAPLPADQTIATTQVFEADGRPVLVVCDGRADPVDLAGVLGTMTVRVVPEPVARLWTGQSPAAIAPVGHAEPVTVIIDVNLSRWRRIWVPAGAPGYCFPTTYSELLRITAGTAAEVGELPGPGAASTLQS
ncbi:MAG: YbaK/EbsC family protein [Candidatus Nanopelagicales bacterium]